MPAHERKKKTYTKRKYVFCNKRNYLFGICITGTNQETVTPTAGRGNRRPRAAQRTSRGTGPTPSRRQSSSSSQTRNRAELRRLILGIRRNWAGGRRTEPATREKLFKGTGSAGGGVVGGETANGLFILTKGGKSLQKIKGSRQLGAGARTHEGDVKTRHHFAARE